jgi:hypothetical protein
MVEGAVEAKIREAEALQQLGFLLHGYKVP